MNLRLFQVDAFAEGIFTGNPAAVVPLAAWLPDPVLQAIAAENNLAETAFYVPLASGYHLRWFTPAAEVALCGHATLATAHVLFEHLGYPNPTIEFQSQSGPLRVTRSGGTIVLDFPADPPQPSTREHDWQRTLGIQPLQVLAATDYLCVLPDENSVRNLQPNFDAMRPLDRRGVVVTAAGSDCDFVSRCFFPKLDVPEDPVTGSSHCILAPYWSPRLGKTQLVGRQLSKRGGTVACVIDGNRVQLAGRAFTYLVGEITLP